MSDSIVERPTIYMPMAKRELVQIALLGAAVGLIVWILTSLLDTYVYHGLLCQASEANQCASVPTFASLTGTIIGAMLGLVGLVRLRLFRPLLVVLAAMFSLWEITSIIGGGSWFVVLLVTAGMYALAYCAFAWIARLTNFFAALFVMIVLTVIVRLILS